MLIVCNTQRHVVIDMRMLFFFLNINRLLGEMGGRVLCFGPESLFSMGGVGSYVCETFVLASVVLCFRVESSPSLAMMGG